jgi:4-hydroxy-4-methyl-2-oxoglutarate aldolase
MQVLTEAQLDALRAIDSPTVANAIERFAMRPRCDGYAGYDLRCAFPKLGPMLGYAVTCTADTTTEGRPHGGTSGLLPLWDALDAAPKPAVLVIKDIGPDPRRSCHMGEVMATVAKALGAVGCVCDGGLRDVYEVEALGGFQYFCPGFVVSHGNPVICEINVPVTLSGLTIRPGDLLHGDVNGLLAVPDAVAGLVAEEAMLVRAAEKVILDLARAPGFTVARLREAVERFTH